LKIDQAVIVTPPPQKPGERNSPDVTTPKAGPNDHMPLPEIAQPNLGPSNSDFADNLAPADPLHWSVSVAAMCRRLKKEIPGKRKERKVVNQLKREIASLVAKFVKPGFSCQ
jgi:hypothetical protein